MASEPIPLDKAVALFVKFMHCGDAEKIFQVHNFMSEVNGIDSNGKKISPKKSGTPKTPMLFKVGKKTGLGVRAIRPLNSYMAFRAYYSPIFAEFPQKSISGFITALWRTDPFKAKWSIIAKAYSEIRDAQGRENTPLNLFLEIAAIGLYIIAPSNYLFQMGWETQTENNECHLLRAREPDLSSFDPNILSTTMSVPELIECCQHYGYPVSMTQPMTKTPFDQGPIMVMTAQVHTNHSTSGNPVVAGSEYPIQNFTAKSPSAIPAILENSNAGCSKQNADNPVLDATVETKSSFEVGSENMAVEKTSAHNNESIEETHGDLEIKDSKTCEQVLKETSDTYPYYKQFDPYGANMDDLFYDPFDPLNPLFGNHALGSINDPNEWLTSL